MSETDEKWIHKYENYYCEEVQQGGPAFPTTNSCGAVVKGMSIRVYAAIHLCVPSSGFEWLDEMILCARRDRLAGEALSGIIADERYADPELMRKRKTFGMTRTEVAGDLAVKAALATEETLWKVECDGPNIMSRDETP